MLEMGGHLLCAVDTETTGLRSGYHEITQIAIQPLDSDFNFIYEPLQLELAPEFPSRAAPEAIQKTGVDLDYHVNCCPSQTTGADLFLRWVERLNLGLGKRLIPLAHNWSFDKNFIVEWLGEETYNIHFSRAHRDSFVIAAFINDMHNAQGLDAPFKSLQLESLCKKFGIKLDNAHSALPDARASAKLYKCLLQCFLSGKAGV